MALRRTGVLGLLLTIILIIGGCSGKTVSEDQGYKQYGFPGPPKIGVMLGSAEKAGEMLNTAVTAGVKGLAVDQDLEYRIMSPGDLVNHTETIRFLAEDGYDLIIAAGKEFEKDLNNAAPEYPETAFAIIDGEVDRPNVLSIRIDDEEGIFLAGVLAASLTKTNLVGYIGGEMTDTRQEKAFARGVRYINLAEGKQVKVITVYAGVTKEAATNPERGKELGTRLYDVGTDVVFTAAGRLGNGLAGAAVEKRKIALTNDRQLLETMPWNVYGAVVQQTETAVYDAAVRILKEGISGGRTVYGLKEGSIDFVLSQAVAPELAEKLNTVREQVKKDQIKPYTVQIPEGMVTQLTQLPVDLNKPVGNGQTGTAKPGSGTGPSGVTGSSGTDGRGPADNGSAGGESGDSNAGGPTGEGTAGGPGNNGTGSPTGNNDTGGQPVGNDTGGDTAPGTSDPAGSGGPGTPGDEESD